MRPVSVKSFTDRRACVPPAAVSVRVKTSTNIGSRCVLVTGCCPDRGNLIPIKIIQVIMTIHDRYALIFPPKISSGCTKCQARKMNQCEDGERHSYESPTYSRLQKVKLSLGSTRSEEHTSELQSLAYLVCRLLL